MAKMGRPNAEIDKNQFEQLCAFQCTEKEICEWFGVSDKTLVRWVKRTYGNDYTFSDIYAQKRAKGHISLRRFQFQQAEHNATMAIWLGKQYLNQRDTLNMNVKQAIDQETINEIEGLINR